jgi:hypothetical protein
MLAETTQDLAPRPTSAPATDLRVAPARPIVIDDESRDSLHMMALATVPIETPGLRRANLVKNARLEAVVELYKGKGIGSGQITIQSLDSAFPSDKLNLEIDRPLMEKLVGLPSFDIYTLRAALRSLKIPVENVEGLTLSPRKRAQLNEYMRGFTKPLLERVYGPWYAKIFAQLSTKEIVAKFDAGDSTAPIARLRLLAADLGVSLEDLPDTLEQFGDVYLSFAYFKSAFDSLQTDCERLIEWMDDITQSFAIKRNADLKSLVSTTKVQVAETLYSVRARLELFDQNCSALWANVTPDNFRLAQELIVASHISIGGTLCGLAVKVKAWKERFPDANGGAAARAEFIRMDMAPGMRDLWRRERNAAKLLEAA